MNIFLLDRNAKIAAQYHGDKHCIKAILENFQMLSTVHRVVDGTLTKVNNRKHYILNDSREEVLYKATHINHPCTIWSRESTENYSFLVEMTKHLIEEYRVRYGKIHKSSQLLPYLEAPPVGITKTEWTEPAQAMPDEYKSSDYVEAYRNYYIHDKLLKRGIVEYKNKNIPFFLSPYMQ